MQSNYPHHQGNMDTAGHRNAAEMHHAMSGMPDASSGANANFNASYDSHMSISAHAGIEVRTQAAGGRQTSDMASVAPTWPPSASGGLQRASHSSIGAPINQTGIPQGNYAQGYPMKAHSGATQSHFAGGPSSEAPSPPTTHRPFSGASAASASAPSHPSQSPHSSQSPSQGATSMPGYPTSAEAYSFWQQQQQYHQQHLLQQQQAQHQHHAAQHMSLQYQQQHAQHMASGAQTNGSQNPAAYAADPASYHSANMPYPSQYPRNMLSHPNNYNTPQMAPNGSVYGNGQQFAPSGYYPHASGQSMPSYPQSASSSGMQGIFPGAQSQGGHTTAQQMAPQLSQYAANSQLGSSHLHSANSSVASSAAVAMRAQQQHPQQQQFPTQSSNVAMPHPSMAHYANTPSNMSHNMAAYGYGHSAAAAAQMASRGPNGMMMHPSQGPSASGHPGMVPNQYGSMNAMQNYNGMAVSREQAMHQHQQHPQYPMAANPAAAVSYGSHHAAAAAQRPPMPVAPPTNPHEDDDDDGEVINSKALAKAESAQNRSKKKRKREGDDDDDEDFTGNEDVDWRPDSRRASVSKRNKRRGSSDWDEPYNAGVTDHLGRANSMMSNSTADSESLVSTRPRRERRTSSYKGYDLGEDDDLFEDEEAPAKKRTTKRKSAGSTAAQPSAAAPSSAAPGAFDPSWQQGAASGYYQDPNNGTLNSASATQQHHPSASSFSSSGGMDPKLGGSAGSGSGSMNRSHTDEDESTDLPGVDGDEEVEGEEDADDGPTIDKVLDYREYIEEEDEAKQNSMEGGASTGSSGALKNATRADLRGSMSADTKVNKQYRIKWKGSSFMHCTWEAYDALVGVRGWKKVENYIKAAIKDYLWRQGASREELELHDVEQEMLQDLYDEHLKVDRVIAFRKNDVPVAAEEGTATMRPSPEYLCVWSKLPYVDATWERAEDIAAYQRKIDQYLNRSQQQLMPRTFYGSRIQRPSFREVQLLQTTPTEWLKGGLLRDYQLQGINWLVFSWCNSTNCILADEMGLGKTIQTLAFLGFLQFRQHIPGPFLIVVPLSTIANWEAESAKWLPDMNTVVYIGDSKSRELIREHEFWYRSNGKLMTKFNTLITSYEIILKDKQHLGSIKWNFLAVDEAHRLKNADSALHEVLNDFTTSSRLLITGTPLQNSLKELWALLNFLEPRHFPSLDLFEREYSKLEGEGQLAALHQRLKPHVLRRFKSQVEKSLPAKNERILRVGMAPIQRKYYRWIINRNFAELNRGLRGQEMRTLSNIVVELKKVCNHPFLFPNAEEQARTMAIEHAVASASGDNSVETQRLINEAMLDTLIRSSGKLMLLDRLLLRLKETGHRVLIFSQMVRMLDLLSEYLRLRAFQFQRLDGSMSRSARQMAMESFNAEGSKDFCFILSTRAGGLGINLATADTVIIFDSDWNPQNDLQAQSRAHRIGQKHVVNIYRLMVKNTVEEDILERAKKKLVLDHLVIQRMSTGKSSHYQATASSGAAGAPSAPGVMQGGGAGAGATGTNASAAGMFSKNELAEIIKFGAEELFKNREDDLFDADGNPVVNGTVKSQLLDDMDVDDILERAEPAPEEVQPGFELLSAFKVASFDTGTEGEDDDKEEQATPTKGRRRGAKSESNPNADFWERVIPAELRMDRVAGADMIVTGPRARKKRIDLSAEVAETSHGHHHAPKDPPTPQRPRSTRKAKSAAADAIHESAIAYAEGADGSAAMDSVQPVSASSASSSATVGPHTKRSPRPRSASASAASAAGALGLHNSASGAYDDSYLSGDEDDPADEELKHGDANGASADGKKRSRSRKGEKKRAAGEGEMDASDVRKLLQTVRTYGCDDIAKVIQNAGLGNKWAGIVETTLNDIVAQCRTCIEEATKPNNPLASSNSSLSHSASHVPPAASSSAMDTGAPLNASSEAPKDEESKGPKTTIKYMDVSINAVQLLTRLADMSDLHSLVKSYSDPYAFRLSVVVKNWAPFASLWSSPIDDAMLLLGAALYGFGQWTKLVTDAKLNLEDKIFGAGQPTSAQLNTRAESLLKVLREAKSTKSGGSVHGSSNPMTDIADLAMPSRRKRSTSTKASSGSIPNVEAGSPSSSPAPSAAAAAAPSAPTAKAKTPKSRRKAADKVDPASSAGNVAQATNPNAAAALAELNAFTPELQAHVASIWEPTQKELRESYMNMSAMPDTEAKVAAYHRFLVSLRSQVVGLAEYYFAAMTDPLWTQELLQACLWSHAAVHICGASRTGSVIQATADHYAKSPPPPVVQHHGAAATAQYQESVAHPQTPQVIPASSSPRSATLKHDDQGASSDHEPASDSHDAHPDAKEEFAEFSDHHHHEGQDHHEGHEHHEHDDLIHNGAEDGADEDEEDDAEDHPTHGLSFDPSAAPTARSVPLTRDDTPIGMNQDAMDEEHDDDLGRSAMDLDAPPQAFEEPDLHNDESDEGDNSHHSGGVQMDEDEVDALPTPSAEVEEPSFHEETGVDDSELETMMNEADQSSTSHHKDDQVATESADSHAHHAASSSPGADDHVLEYIREQGYPILVAGACDPSKEESDPPSDSKIDPSAEASSSSASSPSNSALNAPADTTLANVTEPTSDHASAAQHLDQESMSLSSDSTDRPREQDIEEGSPTPRASESVEAEVEAEETSAVAPLEASNSVIDSSASGMAVDELPAPSTHAVAEPSSAPSDHSTDHSSKMEVESPEVEVEPSSKRKETERSPSPSPSPASPSLPPQASAPTIPSAAAEPSPPPFELEPTEASDSVGATEASSAVGASATEASLTESEAETEGSVSKPLLASSASNSSATVALGSSSATTSALDSSIEPLTHAPLTAAQEAPSDAAAPTPAAAAAAAAPSKDSEDVDIAERPSFMQVDAPMKEMQTL